MSTKQEDVLEKLKTYLANPEEAPALRIETNDDKEKTILFEMTKEQEKQRDNIGTMDINFSKQKNQKLTSIKKCNQACVRIQFLSQECFYKFHFL